MLVNLANNIDLMKKNVWEYIAKESKQNISQWKVCKWTGEQFPVFQKEQEILKKVSPNFSISSSGLSPESRLRTLLMWRNERRLYKRKSDLSKTGIISVFPENTPYPVYQFEEYGTDAWNPFDFAQEIDSEQKILPQIQDFLSKTPKRGLNIAAGATMENCDYCNYGFASKDCYMCQVPLMSEQCYYSNSPFQSKYNFDCYLNEKCENSYESSYCIESYNIFYSDYVEGSSDCYFCYDIQGSKHCIGCVGIIGQEYQIFNEAVGIGEYEKKLKEILSSHENVESFKKEYEIFKNNFPKKNLKNIGEENSYGSTIRHSKNMTFCFSGIGMQEGYHSTITGLESHSLVSCNSGGSGSSYVYQTVGFSASNNSAFNCFGSGNNCFYNYDCRDCEHCMFSLGLMNQKYCIFNKQYSEEEYKKTSKELMKRLEQEGIWGEFFGSELSLFPYNDSPANDHYPVEKIVYLDADKEILRTEKGGINGKGIVYVLQSDEFISGAILDLGGEEKIKIKWRTKNIASDIPDGVETIKGKDLPEIGESSETILNKIIVCEVSERPYRIIEQEFKFYKKYNLPLPRKHPDLRYEERFQKAPKNTLHLRECIKCNQEVLSVWETDDIICDTCYLKNT